MTKVIVAQLRSDPKGRRNGVPKKLVRRRDGRTVYVVDSTSKTFEDDLVRVFKANIAAERHANTAIFGSPDGPKES